MPRGTGFVGVEVAETGLNRGAGLVAVEVAFVGVGRAAAGFVGVEVACVVVAPPATPPRPSPPVF